MINNNLHIADLIKNVQEELIASETRRLENGTPSLFRVSELIIEANFLVEESTNINGGFDLRVITSGMKIDGKSQSVHKITLKLNVVNSVDSTDLPYKTKSEGFLQKLITGIHPFIGSDE